MLDSISKGHTKIPNILGIGAVHLLACFAPFFIDRGAILLSIILFVVTGWLGVTLCYHRLLTHRSFETPQWFKYVLTTIGATAWQGSPITWVGTHRIHHMNSDKQGDPHSPTHGFTWSHILWTFYKDPDGKDPRDYASDLLRDKGISFIGKWFWVPQFAIVIPIALGGYFYEGWHSAIAWIVWGIGVRTVATYHTTWLINSACHTWGRQPHKTGDNSRNSWCLALISGGESFHNNHHDKPNCAAHGRRWWEFDPTYWIINLLSKIGLAWDIVRPPKPKKKSETTL